MLCFVALLPITDDQVQSIKTCILTKELRPTIAKATPLFLEELMVKCWDTNADDRMPAEVR
jgi:hypothetical protein